VRALLAVALVLNLTVEEEPKIVRLEGTDEGGLQHSISGRR
jgi:hypothetical protein